MQNEPDEGGTKIVMTKVLRCLSVMAALLFLTACQNEALVDYLDQPLRASDRATVEDIGDLMESLAKARGWRVNRTSPGVIDASLNRGSGKHIMDVRVTFDKKTFSIVYISSTNMNYSVRDGERRIHPLYNKWVGMMRRDFETDSSRI